MSAKFIEMNFAEDRFAEKRGFRLAHGGFAAAPDYRPASCCLSMYFKDATLGLFAERFAEKRVFRFVRYGFAAIPDDSPGDSVAC